MLTAARAQTALDGQLGLSCLAIAMTFPNSAAGALAGTESLLYQSALWETLVAQAEAGVMATAICADYRNAIKVLQAQGDRMLTVGKQEGERNRLAGALSSFSAAAKSYDRVFDYYRKNAGSCPTWGAAEFNGFYEGVIDFGFIAAAVKVCAAQDEAGTVTGDVRIDIEASNEHMNGAITDGVNTTADEQSTVTGTILVTIGDITAHIVMQNWKYNIATDQWEGQVEVQEQSVTGNVTVKKSSDTCPDGFPGE